MYFNMKVLFLAVCTIASVWKLVDSDCAAIKKVIDQPLLDVKVNGKIKAPNKNERREMNIEIRQKGRVFKHDKRVARSLAVKKPPPVNSTTTIQWVNMCPKFYGGVKFQTIYSGGGFCYVLRPWRNITYRYVYCKFTRCHRNLPWNYRCMPECYKYYKLWMWCRHLRPRLRFYWFKLPTECCCKRLQFTCKI